MSFAVVVPFVLLLLCIAAFPLTPKINHHWERNSVKLGVSLLLGLPVAAWYIQAGAVSPIVHACVEYLQFMILLGALFTVSGGIFLAGDIRASPVVNTAFLAVGAVLASAIGTTGAAMVLIRPILNTNRERSFVSHTVVFAIFIIANSGGLLTPLGDPPLFLGMLRGVPFWWTMTLLPVWGIVNVWLLLSYYILDLKMYEREPSANKFADNTRIEPLRLIGVRHVVLLIAVVATVASLPSTNLHAAHHGHADWTDFVPVRELVLLLLAGLSLADRSNQARALNEFSWTPILEVASLFIGIFLTMVPALEYLSAMAPSLPLNEVTLYVFPGVLSSVLDNAPTYATFFEMAKSVPAPHGHQLVAGVPEPFLRSISLGAVLFGAMTYIGNGPNFMVKAVAEGRGVSMPSFFGYIGWTMRHLAPALTAVGVILFVRDPSSVFAGVASCALWALCSILLEVRMVDGSERAARDGGQS